LRLFVFPNADKETEDAEDEMEMDEVFKIQQGWRRKYHLMMIKITHNEYRPLPLII
jgi:hypothetical protein